MILEIAGPDGKVVWKAPEPEGTAGRLAAGRLPRDRHPGRQHRQEAEPDLGGEAGALQRQGRQPPPGRGQDRHVERRPRPRDLRLPRPPPKDDRPALAVGVWMGNSDHSNPRSKEPAISLTAAAPLWRAFVRDYTKSAGRSRTSRRPNGRGQGDDRRLVRRQARAVDPGQDDAPGSSPGRSPARKKAIDPDGLLYTACLRRLAGGPAQGRARAVELGRRRRRLAAPCARRPRSDGPVRLADGLLLEAEVVGRADRRAVRAEALDRDKGRQEEGRRRDKKREGQPKEPPPKRRRDPSRRR